MNDWFESISATHALPTGAAYELQHRGFTVIPDAVPQARLEKMSRSYDAAMESAAAGLKIGSTTTRLGGFVNLGEEIDALYIYPPLLDACCRIIGKPFKLSSLHARTLRPQSLNGKLHVDVRRDSADWPLVGFILMLDDFRPDNGATRFVPGSHQWLHAPGTQFEQRANHEEQVQACGTAGSMLIFDGSTWHDHAANTSDAPRRSIQGVFIPRDGTPGDDIAAELQPETRARLSSLALYLLETDLNRHP